MSEKIPKATDAENNKNEDSSSIREEIKEKLEKELPYKQCCKKIIWCPIVFLLVAFIVCSVLFVTNVINVTTEINGINGISIVILTILSLLTICSFIFYTIILIKDDCGIRFAKLNELARISEKIDSGTLLKNPSNICLKYNEKTSSETENTGKLEKVTIEEKNYKFELYKKYMDTLADI